MLQQDFIDNFKEEVDMVKYRNALHNQPDQIQIEIENLKNLKENIENEILK